MSERKVINKYFPPDFDPNKANRNRHGKGHKRTVRLMAPYSMQCNSCGEFIYKGKKFNARKEIVQGEQYYGIPIYRFYIKCTRCTSEITFRTDPKNTDYAAEHGATRNFEPWRDNDKPKADVNKITIILSDEEDSEPEIDPMKALEQRTIESQREMEILDALQDIRTRNARHERVDPDAVLQSVALGKRKYEPSASETKERSQEEEEDEALVQKYFGKRNVQPGDPMQGKFVASVADDAPSQPAEPEPAKGPTTTEEDDAPTKVKASASPEKASPEKDKASATPQAEPSATLEAPPTKTNGTDATSAEAPPDAASLLSEASRAQLEALAKPSAMPRPAPKKRRGPNALGIVRK
ncbi:hypothetical protein CBS9595_001273 [Malassezia furfur]|nr:hypothetical protein CBS9595_001273 [Malassezia furfur]